MYIGIYVHTYIYAMFTPAYTHTHQVYTSTCMYVYVCILNIYFNVCVHVCVFVCISVALRNLVYLGFHNSGNLFINISRL